MTVDGTESGTRLKLAALWTSTLFLFAYVDLFSLYRPDVRAEIAAGELAGFTIDGPFLLGATAYVLPAILMVFLSLVMPPRACRAVTLVLCALYALTIAASAIGEWSYYVLGSIVELALLATIVFHVRAWRTRARHADAPAPGT